MKESSQGRRRKGLRRLAWALPILGLAAGIAAMAYLPVTEALDAYRRLQIASSLDLEVEEADDGLVEGLLLQARAWNLVLIGKDPEEETGIAAEDVLEYSLQLSLTGSDIAFAYIVIPSLDLTVPVYHGTSDAVLSAGAGHLEDTSLPVGGESTHAVISAHTGMTGSRMFDDIDELEVGDVVGVKVLGQELCYEVVSTEVVDPDDADALEEALAVVEGEDLLTLVTCWPYGVNTHRLLVRCVRCEVPDGFFGGGEGAAADVASAWASVWASGRLAPLAATLGALLLALSAWIALRARERRRPRRARAPGDPAVRERSP